MVFISHLHLFYMMTTIFIIILMVYFVKIKTLLFIDKVDVLVI